MHFRALQIRLTGRLEVLHDGCPVELPASKKSRALFGYLVVTGRAHTRAKLCELLWDVPDDPRAALRWSLWKIRPFVDDAKTARLITTRDQVSFETHGAAVDLAAIRAATAGGIESATTEALASAARSIQGELLEGLELDDCWRWHQWYVGEREAFRRMHLAILEALSSRLRDRPEEALVHARVRLAIDPLGEGAQLAAMELLAASGREDEAIAHYDAYLRIVERELRSRPAPHIVAWRTRLRAGRPALHAAPRDKPSPRHPASLVGRIPELATCDRFLTESAPRCLLVSGEPGIGKTRLLEELSVRATAQGIETLSGRAFEAERRRPYGPWITALAASGIVDLSALTQVPNVNREALWSAVGGALSTPQRSLLVLMDDLHWADEDTVGLLHHLARVTKGIRFAAAFRPGALVDNVPALRVVRALLRGSHALRLDLAALTPDETRQLARITRPDVDLDRVQKESQGNPFFVIELSRAEQDGDARVPTTLEHAIEERLEALDATSRETLAWVAVFGRDVRAEVLADATDLSIGEVARTLARLERAQLVLAREEAWDINHDLIRRVVIDSISAPRLRLLHLGIARALERHDDAASGLASDVARHAALGGDAGLSTRACIRAGERCLRMFAYRAAESLFELGQRQSERLPREVRVPLRVRLFAIVVHPGLKLRAPEALGHDLVRLAREAAELGLDGDRSRALVLLARLYYHSWADVPRARAALSQAVTLLEKNHGSDVEGLVSGLRCLALIHTDMRRVRTQLEALAALGEPVVGSLYYAWGIGLVHRWEGDFDAARTSLDAAMDLARQRHDHWAEFECCAARMTLELEANDPRAERIGSQLLATAQRLGAGGSESLFARALADISVDNVVAVDRAIVELDRMDAKGLAAQIRGLSADRALEARDVVRAEALARRIIEAAIAEPVDRAKAHVILGRLALDLGDHRGASDAFAHAAALGDDLPTRLRDKMRPS